MLFLSNGIQIHLKDNSDRDKIDTTYLFCFGNAHAEFCNGECSMKNIFYNNAIFGLAVMFGIEEGHCIL